MTRTENASGWLDPLVLRYEELRRAYLDGELGSTAAREVGLALLLRHGMAAWMRATEPEATTPRVAASQALEGSVPHPHLDVVRVLSEMVAAHLGTCSA